MYETISKSGEHKALNQGTLSQGVMSILAGVYIGLGCMMMLMVKSDQSLSPAVSNILSGITFSIGLFAVMTCNGELFTGDCLMIVGYIDGRYSLRKMALTLCEVLFYNLVGILAVLFLFYVGGMRDSCITGVSVVMAAKTSTPMSTLFYRSVLCNFLVCMSVWIGTKGTSITDKFIASLVPVTVFVAMGFEHSIANMFLYLTFTEDIVVTITRLLVCILGNVMGGMVLFGGMQVCAREYV